MISIENIVEVTQGSVVCCPFEAGINGHSITRAFASDLLSDVLRLDTEHLLLITGACNLQTIRTAEMSEISYILFVRGKQATPEMIALAHENSILLVESSFSMFRTCGVLFNIGLEPVF